MPKNIDLTDPAARNKYWKEFAEEHLLGRKITSVRYLTEKEADNLGWGARAVVFQLDDGSIWFPSADDEGNGPGALFGQDAKGESVTMPVL